MKEHRPQPNKQREEYDGRHKTKCDLTLMKNALQKIRVDDIDWQHGRKLDADRFILIEFMKLLIDLFLNENSRTRIKDKKDRATVEQVLDPRTRIILFKLLQRGTIDSIEGCISTGFKAYLYIFPIKLIIFNKIKL